MDYETIVNEVEERDRRKPNLIVSGLLEKEEGDVLERKRWDEKQVEALFQSLCQMNKDAISSVHRIGKVNLVKSTPRLLKVVCRDNESKRALLRKARDLRNTANFKQVYVNPDLTPVQQEQSKRLRRELRMRRDRGEDVVISNGRVIQRNGTQNFH